MIRVNVGKKYFNTYILLKEGEEKCCPQSIVRYLKKEKVEEYLKECETNYVSKAEFAAKNNISDSTFNDRILKYQRDKN